MGTTTTTPSMVDVAVRLPADLVRAVDMTARAEDTTRSHVIRRAVRAVVRAPRLAGVTPARTLEGDLD